MNKWYRLGVEWSKKFRYNANKECLNYIEKNNLENLFNSFTGKDFTEIHYTEICKILKVQPEEEDREYDFGERKYYFYWGLDKYQSTRKKIEKEKLEGSEEQIQYALHLKEKRLDYFEYRAKYYKHWKTTDKYKIGKTGEQLILTRTDAALMCCNILNNITQSWILIKACEFDTRLLIKCYGQYYKNEYKNKE